jgi:hypothetical protein
MENCEIQGAWPSMVGIARATNLGDALSGNTPNVFSNVGLAIASRYSTGDAVKAFEDDTSADIDDLDSLACAARTQLEPQQPSSVA